MAKLIIVSNRLPIIIELLRNPKLAKKVGKKGKSYVRKNFLITRLLLDYLRLINELLVRS